jgi:hypothetical protein
MNMNLDQEVFTIKQLVFAIFGLIGIALYRVLGWLMPITYKIFFAHAQKILTGSLENKVEKLTKETHMLKNDVRLLIRAFLTKDEEALQEFKKFYDEQQK